MSSLTAKNDQNRFFSIGMILFMAIIVGLIFFILESGPPIRNWKPEWTIDLRFILGNLFLILLITIPFASKIIMNKCFGRGLRQGLFRTSIILFIWCLIITICFGFSNLLINYLMKRMSVDNILTLDAFLGAYFSIFILLIIPITLGGYIFMKTLKFVKK